jgi:serine/threonine protein kinase
MRREELQREEVRREKTMHRNSHTGDKVVWVSFANGKEEIHKCIPDQERGKQEVQRLREVQDIPGCVEVLGYTVTKHWVIIEMPATKSKDLMDMVLKLQHLESLEKFNGLFFYVVRSLVETIARMHEKHISHGDIKPENLLVNLDVIVSTIWIDFSSSQQTTAEELVQTDEYGTTEFMAPEVFNRLPHNPMKADVFSRREREREREREKERETERHGESEIERERETQ